MRRKSTRNTTKPQEKSKPPEQQTARKSRRTSKRRRKSTSSDSEKSEEEQDMQVAVESEEATHSDNEADASKSDTGGDAIAAVDKDEPLVERKTRRGNKVDSSVSEWDAKREDAGEDEGRTEKGKSKGKNKAKVEREPTDASGTFTESEICTNAQVTPQSPQTDINNAVTRESLVTQCAADRVDGDQVPEDTNENFMSVDDNDKGVDTVDSSANENIKINTVPDQTEHGDTRDEVIPDKSFNETEESHAKSSDDSDNFDTRKSKVEELESPKVSETNQSNDSSNTSTTKEISEVTTNQTEESRNDQSTNTYKNEEESSKQAEEDIEEPKPIDEEVRTLNTKDERTAVEATSALKEHFTEINIEVNIENEKQCNIENSPEMQDEPKKLRRPEDPKWKGLERKISTQKIRIIRKSTESNETRQKWKWGEGLKLVALDIIDSNIVKTIYPNVQFLQESDVKLDYSEVKSRRFSTAESSDDRSDRRVSIDFDRQTSEDSVRNDLEQEDKANIIAVNRKISIIDDSATMLKPPPSPAKNPVSDVLFITNLVRPFTLKQLRELLERTGKIKEEGFWTDRIKSKCFVQYESEEEAKATREALHGVHWPIGNGKKLIIDYGTEEELMNAKNPPAPPPPPPPPVVEISKNDKENEDLHRTKKEEQKSKEREEKETRRREHVREWDVGKEDMHRSKSKTSHDHERRRHSRRSPSPTEEYMSRKKKKIEDQVPQKLMDDLFQKTKATPSIYWQPLTPDEIATKQQQRLERMAEHKKRLEETSRSRMEYGRGALYRRKYD